MSTKRIKLTEAEAIILMAKFREAGRIDGWSMTKSGYVRYFELAARVWRDLIQYDLTRWA